MYETSISCSSCTVIKMFIKSPQPLVCHCLPKYAVYYLSISVWYVYVVIIKRPKYYTHHEMSRRKADGAMWNACAVGLSARLARKTAKPQANKRLSFGCCSNTKLIYRPRHRSLSHPIHTARERRVRRLCLSVVFVWRYHECRHLVPATKGGLSCAGIVSRHQTTRRPIPAKHSHTHTRHDIYTHL